MKISNVDELKTVVSEFALSNPASIFGDIMIMCHLGIPLPLYSFFIACYNYVAGKHSDDAKIRYEMEKLLLEFKNGELNEVIRAELINYLPNDLDHDLSEIKIQMSDFEIKIQKILENSKKCGLIPLEKKIFSEDNSDKNKDLYYQGVKLASWDPIIQNWDVKRKLTDVAMELLCNEDKKSILVLGNMGDGKTQFIRRVSYDLYLKGWAVYYPIGNINIELAMAELSNINGKKLIVIDNASDRNKSEIISLITEKSDDIQLLISDQKTKWNSIFGNRESYLKENNFEILKLKPEKEDIENCFKKFGHSFNESVVESILRMHSNYELPWIITLLGIYQNVIKNKQLINTSDAVNTLFEDIYNYFDSNPMYIEAILPILAAGYYGVPYPESVYSKKYLENVPKLKRLENIGFIKTNNHFISTFHPYVTNRIFLNYYNESTFFQILKKYLLELIENVSNTEEMNGENGNILHEIGQNLIDENNPEKLGLAYEFFKKIISLDSKDFGAFNNVGAVLCHLNKHEESIPFFKNAILLNDMDSNAYSNLGAVYHTIGKLDLALPEFKKSVELNPNYPDTWRMLGELYNDMNDPFNAEYALKKALKSNPHDLDAKLHLAFSYMAQLRYNEAISEFLGVLSKNNNSMDALILLGDIYEKMENDELSSYFYDSAYQIDKNSVRALSRKASYEINHERHAIAIKYLKKALEIDPINLECRTNLILCYWWSGKKNKSKKLLESFVKTVPNNLTGHLALGNIYYQMENLENSKIHYQEALKINPRSFEAYPKLSDIYMKQNQLINVMTLLKKATTLYPEYSTGFHNLAVVQHELGDMEYEKNAKNALELFSKQGDFKGISRVNNFLDSITSDKH